MVKVFNKPKATLAVPNGVYFGEIVEAVIPLDRPRSRSILRLKVKVIFKGKPVILGLEARYAWNSKRLNQILENLDLAPDFGCPLNLDEFVGVNVIIQVRKETRNGMCQSKIVSIKKEIEIAA